MIRRAALWVAKRIVEKLTFDYRIMPERIGKRRIAPGRTGKYIVMDFLNDDYNGKRRSINGNDRRQKGDNGGNQCRNTK